MSATNFWQESIDTYDLKFYPQFAPNFYHQLNALTVFYCFGILFLVTGFAVRIWRGWNHCWLLRLERTENGLRIHQNTAVAFLLFKGLFCIHTNLQVSLFIGKCHSLAYCYMVATSWWRIVEAIGMLSASPLLRSAEKLITIQKPTRAAPRIPYLLTNFFTIIYLIVSLMSILIPFILANHYFNKLTILYFVTIRPILEQASETYNGHLDIAFLNAIIPLQADALLYLNKSALWTRAGFILLDCWAVLTFIVFLVGATSVYRVLKYQKEVLLRTASTLRLLTSQQHEDSFGSSGSSSGTYTLPLGLEEKGTVFKFNGSDARLEEACNMEAKAKELEIARRLLICQGVVFTVCTFGYSAICIAVALYPISAVENPTYYSWIQLGGSWIYALIGIPGMFLVTLSGIISQSQNFIGAPSSAENHPKECSLTELSRKKKRGSKSQDSNKIFGSLNQLEGDNLEMNSFAMRQVGASIGSNQNRKLCKPYDNRKSLAESNTGGDIFKADSDETVNIVTKDIVKVDTQGWRPSAWAKK